MEKKLAGDSMLFQIFSRLFFAMIVNFFLLFFAALDTLLAHGHFSSTKGFIYKDFQIQRYGKKTRYYNISYLI